MTHAYQGTASKKAWLDATEGLEASYRLLG